MANAKKTKSGNYRVQVYDYTDEKNKKHYRSFTAPTKRDAEIKALLFRKASNSALSGKLTVYEAVRAYVEAKESVLSESTIRSYKNNLRKYFEGTSFGNQKIDTLTNVTVQNWIKSISGKVTPKTVSNVYGLFSTAMRFIDKTKSFNVTLPKGATEEFYIPTDEEIQLILDNCDKKYRFPLSLAAFGGLRRGEIMALTRSDFKDGGVYVNKDLVLDENREWVIKPMPKTENGIRFVPLDQSILDMANELKPFKFDFEPETLGRNLVRTQKKLGMERFSLHKLRHYCCSRLIWLSSRYPELGLTRQDILYIMGWSDTKMIDKIYGHSRMKKDRERLKQVSQKMVLSKVNKKMS